MCAKKNLSLYQAKVEIKKIPATTYSSNLLWLVPSAQCRFTSEFGMGSGGTNMLLSPGKNIELQANSALIFLNRRLYAIYNNFSYSLICKLLYTLANKLKKRVKSLDRLVSVSYTHLYPYTPDLSTSWFTKGSHKNILFLELWSNWLRRVVHFRVSCWTI